jgi:hypothetical protein
VLCSHPHSCPGPDPSSGPCTPPSTLQAVAHSGGRGCWVVVLAVVFMPAVLTVPAFPMPLAPSSCHPHPWCSPFPPHEQLLVVAVQGAAVLADMGVVRLQGRYPPPGVSRCPSYVVHHMSFVHRTSFVVCCLFVIHHLFIVCLSYIVHILSICHLYVVVYCSFVVCMLLYIVHMPFVCRPSYIVCTLSYAIRLHTLLYVLRCPSSFVCCHCGNKHRNIVENSLLVTDKKDKRYKKTCLGPKQQ